MEALQHGRGLCSFFDLSTAGISTEVPRRNIVIEPRAAVFKVPNGKLRSETGSHTSISPSRMMLEPEFSQREAIQVGDYKLVDARIESLVDIRCQAPYPNVLSIKICVILALP